MMPKTSSAACWSRTAVALMCAALVLACGGERSSRLTGLSGTGGAGTAARDASLIGSWWRIVLFAEDDGTTHASETTWRFEAEGDASRTVVATNLTYGFFDSVTVRARWATDGGSVVITYLAPNTGTVRFAYRVSGDTLLLGDRGFLRQP